MLSVTSHDSLSIKKEIKYTKVWEKSLCGNNELSKFQKEDAMRSI